MDEVNAVRHLTPQQIDHLVFGIIIILMVAAFLAASLVWLFKPKKVFGIDFSGMHENKDEAKLVHHRLFKFFAERLSQGGIQFDGTDKAIIMENFLRLKFQTIQAAVKEFAQKMDRDDFEGLSRFPEVVQRAVETYEAESKNLVHETSAGRVRGVPCCMVRKFRRWHRRHELQFFQDTSDLMSDRSITSKKERAWLLYDALFYALRETIFDGEATLPSLNGDFDDEFSRMIQTQTGCGEADGC